MKEAFGKGFGFIVGIYAALVGIKYLDKILPDDKQVLKEAKEVKSDFEEGEL